MIELLNIDCMEYMKTLPDKAFDLAVVDPPYGLGNRLSDGGGKLKNTPMAVLYRGKDWDVKPTPKYWEQLFRISKNQVIHGANYFLEFLPSSRGFVCWDKKQHMITLSACEFIWTSFDKPAKMYRQVSTDLNRFHPTQKPVALYDWILRNYAKPGQRILDTHLGSGSSAIAAHYFGCDFVGCEIDTDYFNAAKERFDRETRQIAIEFINMEQEARDEA